jgi:hypothetical protein
MEESIERQAGVPLDFLGDLRRTHTCGQLRSADAGARVVLMGWVHRRHDLGGVIFIHLRDRDGITQIVFHEDVDAAIHGKAEALRTEYVVAVEVWWSGARGHREPQRRYGRSRGRRREAVAAERLARAAVPVG